jgi:predicted DNA-binding protein with PD1-like motif
LSRRDGSVVGGHCKGRATVRTTAEIVLGVLPQIEFAREHDECTGYLELQIRDRVDGGREHRT